MPSSFICVLSGNNVKSTLGKTYEYCCIICSVLVFPLKQIGYSIKRIDNDLLFFRVEKFSEVLQ